MTATVRYFASLRERAGVESESIDTAGRTLDAIYAELSDRHGFAMTKPQVRVAVNGDFVDWSRAVSSGDEIVFIPPVSGG